MRYRHQKYTWSKPFSSVRHQWEIVGPYGAVHFHVSLTENYGPSCGLEFHHTEEGAKRVGRFADEAPHQMSCPMTGGRCWHDGTSLYASAHIWPMVESYLRHGEHEHVFHILEQEADRHFQCQTAEDQQ